MGGKVCLRCKGKTLLGIVDSTQQCFALLPQKNFPANNLNFHWSWRWWDRIQAIFLNLFYFKTNVLICRTAYRLLSFASSSFVHLGLRVLMIQPMGIYRHFGPGLCFLPYSFCVLLASVSQTMQTLNYKECRSHVPNETKTVDIFTYHYTLVHRYLLALRL